MRILSGIQPSGALHLGNYFGAIRQFVELQKEEGDHLYFIANLHALTSVRSGAELQKYTNEVALNFLALGLDPQKSTLFRQSDIPFHTELYWILGTLTPMALLERGHSYKDKLARGFNADFGLFAYPALMAADILLYRADRVPVGKDQKQHLEIARDIATKFNLAYVPGYDAQDPEALESRKHKKGILKLPDPLTLDSTAVVPGTDGQKMSKSYGNAIDLFGTDKELKKQIMGIVTDCTPVEAPKDPDHSNLFLLLKLFLTPSETEDLRQSFLRGGTGYGTYKKQLLDAFHAAFDPARQRRAELEKNMGAVEDILREGAKRAEAIARPVIEEIRSAVGITGR